jgi:hypothetical protein
MRINILFTTLKINVQEVLMTFVSLMWPRNGEFEYIKFVYIYSVCILQPVVKNKSLPEWKPVPVFRSWNQISFCC